MIPNVQKLIDPPIARTNLITLMADPLTVIKCLLAPISNLYAIDFLVQEFAKKKDEKTAAYHARIHKEVKSSIRQKLGLDANQVVQYELHRLPTAAHIAFFLAPAAAPNSPAAALLAERITKLCQRLAAENHSVSRLIQGLFSLHLKMVMLEQASERFAIAPTYFNSALYLNARLSQANVMEAFELDIYASEYNELAFTLHKRKFLVEPSEELHLTLDDTRVWFNTDNHRLLARRKLDARDSKLNFFCDRSGYGECQAYTYNVVMNAASERLHALGIPHQALPFQASHEVQQFATDLDNQLANTLLVVNNGVIFSAAQEARFFAALTAQFPGWKLWPLASLLHSQQCHFADLPANTSILVLNAVDDQRLNSIRQLDDETAEYNDFYAVFDTARKNTSLAWDTYTQLKLERLQGWIAQTPLPVVLQGMNIDSALLQAMDLIHQQATYYPEQYAADLAKPRSRLKSAVNLLNSKLRRTKTELWFKEVLLNRHPFALSGVPDGDYIAYSVRRTKQKSLLLGHVELKVAQGQLQVVTMGVTAGESEQWLKAEHPPLARITKMFDRSFYLYDYHTDTLLTSYHSSRVPRLIGPEHFDVVEWYASQEREKKIVENQGRAFSEYIITRSAKPEHNVLPYLIAPGRGKADPLTKNQKMRHHHIWLQPHEQGTFVLVSDAQPTNPTIARANLVDNVLIWNNYGEVVDVFNHPLSGVYLNSFTLDMLRSGESSKSSIFAKLARLLLEN